MDNNVPQENKKNNSTGRQIVENVSGGVLKNAARELAKKATTSLLATPEGWVAIAIIIIVIVVFVIVVSGVAPGAPSQ